MNIFTKKGHEEVSNYLTNYCKEIRDLSKKGHSFVPIEKLCLISSSSLWEKVQSSSAWLRPAEAAIRPLTFSTQEASELLQSFRLTKDANGKSDKNLSDFKASLIIYTALKDLPITASVDWTLWCGLAFGDCSEYMKERWNVPPPSLNNISVVTQSDSDEGESEDEIEGKPKKITDPIKRAQGILMQRWIGHGAGTTALTRHGVGRLWWIARVADMASKEPEAKGKSLKHYLKILYADQNIQWSIVLRRYGAMSRLVSVLLDKIYKDYLEQDDSDDKPYKLRSGKSVNDIKQFTKLLNTSAGGSLYDLKQYKEMEHDVAQFQNLAKEGK
jgi:hypothetical protein